VGTLVVVGGDPRVHGLLSFGGGDVGVGVGPFAQGCLDEALGLAVGARGVWPGSDVPEAGLGEKALEEMAAIGGAVIAHDALDADAVGLEEGECAGEEGAGAFLALVGQEFGVGEAGGVVDGDVQVLPADPAGAAGVIAMDAVADAISFLVSMWISSPGRSRS